MGKEGGREGGVYKSGGSRRGLLAVRTSLFSPLPPLGLPPSLPPFLPPSLILFLISAGVHAPSPCVVLQSTWPLRSSRGVATARRWTGGHWGYSSTRCWWGKLSRLLLAHVSLNGEVY